MITWRPWVRIVSLIARHHSGRRGPALQIFVQHPGQKADHPLTCFQWQLRQLRWRREQLAPDWLWTVTGRHRHLVNCWNDAALVPRSIRSLALPPIIADAELPRPCNLHRGNSADFIWPQMRESNIHSGTSRVGTLLVSSCRQRRTTLPLLCAFPQINTSCPCYRCSYCASPQSKTHQEQCILKSSLISGPNFSVALNGHTRGTSS